MWHAYVNYKHKVARAEVQLALVDTQCLSGRTDCPLPLATRAPSLVVRTRKLTFIEHVMQRKYVGKYVAHKYAMSCWCTLETGMQKDRTAKNNNHIPGAIANTMRIL